MSWAKLDDALLDHAKIVRAAELFGRDGPAKALGFYASGLLYAQKHLTNGFLSRAVIARMRIMDRPLAAAKTMVTVGLWEHARGGFQIHDFHQYNPKASDVKKKIARISRERSIAGTNGAKRRWQKR